MSISGQHLGSELVQIIRVAEWCIVPKLLVFEPLTLKSDMAAPRSPVNNCGKLTDGGDPVMTPSPSEQAAAVLNLIECGVISWNEPDAMKVLNAALKAGASRKNRQQRNATPLKAAEQAPSARMTKAERERISKIRLDLAQEGITPERWELDVLVREGTVFYGDKKIRYVAAEEWPGFTSLDV